MSASERAFELQKLRKIQRSNSMQDLSSTGQTAHMEAKTQEVPSATVATDQAPSTKAHGENTKVQREDSGKESSETKTSQDIRDKIFRI